MKKWLFFLFLMQMICETGAQTVEDRTSRWMITQGGNVMIPLKGDFLQDLGVATIRPNFIFGVNYSVKENWGFELEGQIGSLHYRQERVRSANRRPYIPQSFQVMDLGGENIFGEWNFVGAGTFFRNRMGEFWLQAELLAGVSFFSVPKVGSVFYKEQGTHFIYRHTLETPEDMKSFVVSPRISVQHKLTQRLGLAIGLGLSQPFGKVDYQMRLTDVYQRGESVFKQTGRIDAPAISANISLILNLRSIKEKNGMDMK